MTYEEVRAKLARKEKLTVADQEVLVNYVRGKIRRLKMDKAGHSPDCTVYTGLLDPDPHCSCGAIHVVDE